MRPVDRFLVETIIWIVLWQLIVLLLDKRSAKVKLIVYSAIIAAGLTWLYVEQRQETL
jgi:hypothetical protein